MVCGLDHSGSQPIKIMYVLTLYIDALYTAWFSDHIIIMQLQLDYNIMSLGEDIDIIFVSYLISYILHQ